MMLLQTDSSCERRHRVKKVGNYSLCAKIGRGSSASVYLGIDQCLQKYAIKVINLRDLARSSAGVSQLEREIRLMRLFNHRNILKIAETFVSTSGDKAYLVLEYAENGSLGSFIERGQQLSQRSVLSIMKQTLEALQYLHNAGYVHHDIKPCNILLDRVGRAKLADFGIGHSFTSASMVVGSPAFQAPEALDDRYSSDDEDASDDSSPDGPQKEDIWALGVTLYQLLFQRLPFAGDNLYEIVRSIKEDPLEIPEDCDPQIALLLRAMLCVDPARRIGVAELLQHPLIVNAPDLAPDLPDVPMPKIREGQPIECEVKLCPDELSFASLPLCVPRRFSYHVRSSTGVLESSGGKGTSHSDGEDDDSMMIPMKI
jgi:serine/threonine-protein kinase 11